MALVPTTRVLTTTYQCMNPSNPATGLFSLYVNSGVARWKTGSTTTLPTDDSGSINLPPANLGGGIKNETIASVFPGCTDTYIFMRMEQYTGEGVIACA